MSTKIDCCLLWSYFITPKSGLALRPVGLKLCCISIQNMHPKRRSANVVLQSSAIQPASQSAQFIQLPKPRHFQQLPMLYFNQAQSSLHPKRGTPTTIKHNPASIRNEALPVLNLYYNLLQSSTNPASIRNEILPALKHQVDGSGQR